MITSRFAQMVEVKYPIIGAPMFLVSYEDLVVEVSEAGALGAFPLPNYLTIEELKQALNNIKEKTSKPIGVNIQLHGRFPWKEQMKVCLDYGVKCFITSLGDPSLIIKDVHANGGIVLADVVNLKQALKAQDAGVDGLIAVGHGAGGHGGTISTMVLVPYLVKNTNLPILAAGGIATGRQMAAALALGADGVVVGTRLIATYEAKAALEYKNEVIKADPEDIVFSSEITGNRASWLASSLNRLKENPDLITEKWKEVWSAGQTVAQVEGLMGARQVIEEIVEECINTVNNLVNLFRSK